MEFNSEKAFGKLTERLEKSGDLPKRESMPEARPLTKPETRQRTSSIYLAVIATLIASIILISLFGK